MFKAFSSTTTLSLILVATLSEATLSQSIPGTSANFEASPLDNAPFCYMETGDGRIMDLTQLCGNNTNRQRSQNTSRAVVRINPQSNLGGLRRIAEATGCFGLDANGRPCPTVP